MECQTETLRSEKSQLYACKLPLRPSPGQLRGTPVLASQRTPHVLSPPGHHSALYPQPQSQPLGATIPYNRSRRNVSSVAESVTRFGSVSICKPSKSRGSRPSLSTSSDGKRSESKLSGIPTIALPMSLTKSWRDSVSSAPEIWTDGWLVVTG